MGAQHLDVIVLGGGMAGATVAAHVAPGRKLALLEREPQLAYHATGRSAAMFIPSYGSSGAQALSALSREFFHGRPLHQDAPIFTPRDVLHVARPGEVERLGSLLHAGLKTRPVSQAEALGRVPVLRPEAVEAAVIEEDCGDIDVAALHAHYIARARQAGASIHSDLSQIRIDREGEAWKVEAADGESWAAPILVNATGAWADETARRAGVAPLGLEPRLRTAVVAPAPAFTDFLVWPTVMSIAGDYYFRPFGGQLLMTACDAWPSAPCDAAPDPIGVAQAIERFERATRLNAPSGGLRRWGGLRTFAADEAPRIGWAQDAKGFLWVAGLGGFGIQTSPAVGATAAQLIETA